MTTVIKTVLDYQSDIAGSSVPYNSADNVVIEDSAANLAHLTTSDISALITNNVDSILSNDNLVQWNISQWGALGGNFFDFNGANTVLLDTGANLGALNEADIQFIGFSGAHFLDASDDVLSITTSQLQAMQDCGMSLTAADDVTVTDKIYTSQTYFDLGVDNILGPTVVKTVAEYQADISGAAVPYNASDGVVLQDTAANLRNLTPTQIGDLFANGVDWIHSDDALIQWNESQWLALGSPFDMDGAAGAIYDTGAGLSAISAANLSFIASLGALSIDASDDAVSFDAGQLAAINGVLFLTLSDTVTFSDAAANIDVSAANLGNLIGQGVDIIDATDDGPFALDTDAAFVLGGSALSFAASDDVTVTDTALNLQGLDTFTLAQLAAKGVDSLDSTDDTLSFTSGQYAAMGAMSFTAGDAVVLADTGAKLAALNFSNLSGDLVDSLDATDNQLKITIAQYSALGGVALTAADTVTILDTGAHIAAYAGLSGLGAGHVDQLDASDNVLRLTIAQLNGLGSVTLTAADTVSMADTEANIEALPGFVFWSIYGGAGVDIIDADENVLNLSADQVGGVVTAGTIKYAAGDLVTLVDSSTNVLSTFGSGFGALATINVDAIDLTDDAISLSVAQSQALGSVSFAASDTGVVVADTEAHLEALNASAVSALASQGVDRLDSTDDVLSFTTARYAAMGSMIFTAADSVTVSGSSAALLALDLSALSTHNVDRIDSTDDVLALTVAQIGALGTTQLTAADAVTVVDTGAHLAGMSAATLGTLAGLNVDALNASDDAVSFSTAQLDALGSVALTAGDTVTLLDAQATIEALGPGAIGEYAAQGVDIIDSLSDALNVTADQVGALIFNSLTYASGDTVVIADSSTNIQAVLGSSYGELAGTGVDSIDLTDDGVSLDLSHLAALGTVGFAASDTGVVALDTQANLDALSVSDLAALASQGVDRLDASDDAVTFTVAQYGAMGSMVFTAGDTVVVTGTGAELAGLTLSALSGDLVDRIDATDDALSLSIAQVNSLGSTQLTAADTVTLADTSANIEALTFNQITVLGAAGLDVIDATDDALQLTASQIQGVATVTGLTFAPGDDVTLVDSAANVLGQFGSDFGKLADLNVDSIDLTDNAILLTSGQVLDLAGLHFAADDTDVTLADTGAHLGELGGVGVTNLQDLGVDRLDATDDVANFSLGQLDEFQAADLALTAGDLVTAVDLGADFAALSPADIAGLAAYGVDQIALSDHHIKLSGDQYVAFQDAGFSFDASDLVRVKFAGIDDVATGGAERDFFDGGSGNDVLIGGDGADRLKGGLGSDTLTGGAGSDTFLFSSHNQTGLDGSADVITDLTNSDLIDLQRMDADLTTAGDQAFTLVSDFTHHAGELLVKYNARFDTTVFKFDLNGDGVADGAIKALGDHTDFTDFVL